MQPHQSGFPASAQKSVPFSDSSSLAQPYVGAAQVLATGKTAGAETDIKYAIIGTAVGIAISAGFLALKFCMIRKHMFDNDSSDLRSTNVGFNETIALKKRASRNAQVIEL
ncbi:hypothetical protein Celaphus_00008395 [Cervus elaphus hippelaphus]|uniref:Transmembrane protein 273 n=1 Tax=Cervus elaphus hippelaphus TaxID=46360 RepID=A0A212CNH1_CEREH|nr:hypothetical protein Celaphus_00008395 [Cervus elaphus hippelaphus]